MEEKKKKQGRNPCTDDFSYSEEGDIPDEMDPVGDLTPEQILFTGDNRPI